MTPYLLLAAIAWAVATRGATDLRDLVVVLALLAAAMISGRAWPRTRPALWVTVSALLAWVIVEGPIRTGWSLESIRVPFLVVLVAITVLSVAAMSASDREALVSGLVVLGTLQAAIALIGLARTAGDAAVPPRAEGLVGFPNGLGVLLIATSVLTVREFERRRGRVVLAMALALQAAAILATGSRTAIMIGAVLVGAVLIGRATAGLRIPSSRVVTGQILVRYAFAGCALAAGIAVFAWRTAVEPNEDRPHLWIEAVQRIAVRPLFGEGAPAVPFALASPDSRITTSAHNEILQWVLEYGLVGLGLAVAVVILALRGTRPRRGGDRWALVAAAGLLASGLTGFSPRITAVAVAAAALIALATTNSPASDPGPPGTVAPARSVGRSVRV